MTSDPRPERLTVRIKEACRMTGIGRSKLYELIAEGEIDIVKVGTMTLIRVDSLKALTEGRRQRR
ncbi:MAG: helix-turn-helix domain-containing protein [Sphingobium sp.]